MKKNQAFSLIEMLIGLSIFSVISVTLYGAYSSGIKLNQRAQHINKIYREARWTMDSIEKDLEHMVFYDYSASYPDLMSFVGSPERLTFLTVQPEGLVTVSYYLQEPDYGTVHQVVIKKATKKNVTIVTKIEEKEGIKFLVRKEIPFVDYVQKDEDLGESEIISSRIQEEGIKFSYAMLQGEEKTELLWIEQWSQAQSPAGVRVELTFASEKGKGNSVYLKRDIFIPTGSWGEKTDKEEFEDEDF